jgi:hypothetical protein
MADYEWVLAEYNIHAVTVYAKYPEVRDTGYLHFFYDYPYAYLTCGWRGHDPAVYWGAYYDAERVGTNLYYWEAWYPYGYTPVPR